MRRFLKRHHKNRDIISEEKSLQLAKRQVIKMKIARFDEIKEKFEIKNDELFIYIEEPDQTLKLIRLNEYAILAEEGLRDVYDREPDGVWEKCLES